MYWEPFVVDGVLVSVGRVMKPEEVSASLAFRPGFRDMVNGWYLCGDVHRKMYDRLVETNGTCDMSLGIIPAGKGGNYAILRVDAEDFRHVFVLPLFEPPVIGLLESLYTKPIQLSLARQNEDAAALIGTRVPWQHVSEVLRYRQQATELAMSDVFATGGFVLDRVRAVEAVKSMDGRSCPERSSVSFIMPEAALAACEQLAGMLVGQAAVH